MIDLNQLSQVVPGAVVVGDVSEVHEREELRADVDDCRCRGRLAEKLPHRSLLVRPTSVDHGLRGVRSDEPTGRSNVTVIDPPDRVLGRCG